MPVLRLATASEADDASKPKPERWTRGRVAGVLGCSISSVRRLEESGELHPEVGERGIRFHDPDEVRDLVARQPMAPSSCDHAAHHDQGAALPQGPEAPGVVAAEVFELFEGGITPVEVVINLERDPATVEALYERWSHLRELPEVADLAHAVQGIEERLAGLEQALAGLAHSSVTGTHAFGDVLAEFHDRLRMLELQVALRSG